MKSILIGDVAKYAGGDGRALWSRPLGGPGSDAALGAAADKDGGVVVAGFYAMTADLVGARLVSRGNDGVVIKLSSAGQLVWSRGLGGGSSLASSVAVDRVAGSVAVTGFFMNRLDVLEATVSAASVGVADVFVLTLAP